MNLFQKRTIYTAVGVVVAAVGFFLAAGGPVPVSSQTTSSACALTPGAYKTPLSSSVYHVSSDCTRRAIKDPNVFFSHYTSWSDVRTVSEPVLFSIRQHELTFLPWGPRRTYQNGSLLKQTDNPTVYLLSNGVLNPIASETVIGDLGLQWGWVEDVTSEVIGSFSRGASLTGATAYPDRLVFKYNNSPEIYTLERSTNGTLQKRYVATMTELTQLYRIDRIAILPPTKVFPDAPGSQTPTPTPAPVTPTSTTATTTIPANALPVVTLTTPANNTTITPGTNVIINATATDSDGTIRRVEFYQGSTLLATDVTRSYRITWRSVPAGTYTLTARATDNSGGVGISAPITLVVGTATPTSTPANTAPTVSITSPSNNSTVTAGTSVTISATASDTGGSVTQVEFLNNGSVIGSDAASPYSLVWTPGTAGTYTLTARATDNGGLSTLSSGITVTVSASTTVPPPTTPPPPTSGGSINTANANSPIGTNVSLFREWVSEFHYKDAFRRSRVWSCTPGPCSLDSNGWVRSLSAGQVASTIFFTGGGNFLDNKYPGGQYIVLYDGEGDITYNGTATKDTAASRTGRDVVNVTPVGSFGLTIRRTEASNPIKNIRVIMPGGECNDIFTYAASAAECNGTYTSFESSYLTQPFHPLYLSSVKNYKTIRFMWFMLPVPYVQPTRVTDPVEWSERPKMTDAHWTATGVPVESMVALANTLNADAWFNMPHLATDEYMREFATYVRDHLNPNLKAYIEYSNEVWNGGPGGYESAEYCKAEGTRLGLSNDPFQAQLRYYSQRAVQMFRIWNDVYGGRSTRVVRVLAGQMNPWTGVQIMDWQNAYQEADAYAIAPYFNTNPTDEARVAAYNTTQLFDYINSTLIPNVELQITGNAENTRTRNIELITYEGGQHLIERPGYENNANMNRLYDDANRDPRMGEVYTRLLTSWKNNGGHLFMHLTNVTQYMPGNVGRFGSLESLVQNNVPVRSSAKYDALQNFIRNNPRWW